MITYPLSNAQKRIWYTQKIYPESSLYNIGGTVNIKGDIDFGALKRAISSVVFRNQALRLQFTEHDNDVCQYENSVIDNVEFIDFSLEQDPREAINIWSKEKAQTHFTMLESALYYFAVFRISENETGYFIKLHHIIADGWSIKLLTEQITSEYENIVNTSLSEYEDTYSYIDYVYDEKAYLSSAEANGHKTYWNKMFNKFYEVRSNYKRSLDGRRVSFILEEDTILKLGEYIQKRHISLYTFFVCVYLIYEYKKYGERDIIIGTPLLGRKGRKDRSIFGTFTNTMPYRYVVDPNETIEGMMSKTLVELRKSYSNQRYPYNLLYNDIKKKNNSMECLYDVCINYYNTIINKSINGIQSENTEFYNGQQEYGMQMIIRHWDDKFQLDFDYHTDVYTSEQIENLYMQLNIIINQVLNNDNIKIKDVILINDNDRQKVIYDFNDTMKLYQTDKTWLNLFEQAVGIHPKKTAISKDDKYLSYSELNYEANGLAKYLKSIGVKSGDIIATLLEHNINSVIAIIAIMKCGAVYLPIDINTPTSRVQNILEDCNAEYLFANKIIDDYNKTFINYDHLLYDGCSKDIDHSSPANIAYMIYTSGSAGKPKGVAITHRNLMNYLCWAKDNYIKNANEVFALYSSFAFDFTMTSIFLPLITGCEIRIYENATKANVFADILKENKSTIIKITPSHITLINDVKLNRSNIHTFIIGGEKLKTETCKSLYKQFYQNINVFNEYGPTEATIGCMIYLYRNNDSTYVPIGKPIYNTQIYLLDKDLKPVPHDTLGEIYISGDGVAKAYNNDSESIEKFIINPFINHKIMFKTGDMAYRNDDDDIVFVCRNDNEAKINGYRVNLSEIEQTIISTGMIIDVFVTQMSNNNNIQLCAYVAKKEDYSENRLTAYLEEKLPYYMIPKFIVVLEQLPLTLNGKIDKSRLPNPLKEVKIHDESTSTKELGILLDIIREVISNKNIGSNDNYYIIGGDSIKAIQISSRLDERGYILAARDILKNPVINEMVHHIKLKTQVINDQSECSGNIVKTPIVAWFLEKKFINAGHYNQSILLELKQNISLKVLNNVFMELIKHHDILRLNYNKEENELFYNNEHLRNSSVIDTMVNYSGNIVQTIKKLKHEFDLENELLIKPYLLVKDGKSYIYIKVHHLVVDGVSWRILLDDISSLLTKSHNEDEMKLPEKTSSYQNYAQEYISWASEIQIDKKYWDEVYNTPATLMMSENSINTTYAETRNVHFKLKKEYTQDLLGKANEPYNTKVHELVIIALAKALYELYHIEEVIFEMESHGRDRMESIDLNRTVGWFTDIYPVKVKVTSNELHEQIKSMKEQIRRTSKRAHEYGILKFIRKEISSVEKSIRFNYLGEFIEYDNINYKVKQLMLNDEISQNNQIDFIIDVNAVVINDKLNVKITYDKNIFTASEINNIIKSFKNNIIDIVEHCLRTEERIYTPDDFDMVDMTQEELDSLLE